MDLGGLGRHHDLDIGQAAQLALQHFVGTQGIGKLDQRDVLHNAGQVDGSFDTRVAAANDRHSLALKERAVAVRAVGYTGVAVLNRKSTRLNSSHVKISYAVFCLKKKQNSL